MKNIYCRGCSDKKCICRFCSTDAILCPYSGRSLKECEHGIATCRYKKEDSNAKS